MRFLPLCTFSPFAGVVALLITAHAPVALAADNKTAARAAAQAGKDAYERADYAEAERRFEQAERLMHAPPHLLLIARSRAQLGKLVAAREAYLALINEALPDRAPPGFVAAQDQAKAEVETLTPRIPQVTVNVEGGEQAELVVDGQSAGQDLTGIPFPVDPGPHVLQVRTSDAESEAVTVQLAEGARQVLTLKLVAKQPPAPLPVQSAKAAPAAPEPAVAADPVHVGADSRAPNSLRPVFIYGGFGLGAVGLGTGIVTGLMAKSQLDDVKSDYHCNDDVCDVGGATARDDANRTALISTIAFGAGAVGLGLGIYGLLIDDPAEASSPAAQLSVDFTMGSMNGLSAQGSF